MPQLDGKDTATSTLKKDQPSLCKLAEGACMSLKESNAALVGALETIAVLQKTLENERQAHKATRAQLIEQMEMRIALQLDMVELQMQTLRRLGQKVPTAGETKGNDVLDGKD
ncbi:hypothetical protein NLJ89_g6476 [Agrocybe chaxingu]|uniref:Uncharacterized protein n=1 Tax=Agrocybe chaxingu TaxID=84603 RepID=A0A9W8MSN6_9AGAR|nr:hypothetical protein NLJ89_g6476 [Agrocybe chaxingu]